jgi:hypothetical protein
MYGSNLARTVMFFIAVLVGVGLIIKECTTPPHDPYSKPERRFAAPPLSVPTGCSMIRTRFGDELTKSCDTPATQLAFPADFDLHLVRYKTSHMIRLGNNVYSVDCGRVWPGCQISDSQADFFFQPTAAQIAAIRAHRTRFRQAPVQLARGLYAYPDMFPERP